MLAVRPAPVSENKGRKFKVGYTKFCIDKNKKIVYNGDTMTNTNPKSKITYWTSGVEKTSIVDTSSVEGWLKILRDAEMSGIKVKDNYKKPSKKTVIKRINKSLGEKIPTYNNDIPLETMFKIVKEQGGLVVDEAGEPWSGLLCGEQGHATMEIQHPDYKNMYLHVGWYKMPSARWEVTVSVS